MGTVWTKEQQEVMNLRDCNMLVSAAAGSGKTAVLVERIVSRIMDDRKPVDIDRLLVVTFTNAAAAEMRERIAGALEEKLEQQPENVHLQRQATLIHQARITTIHSFCLDVIRNHFDRISLDPGFRIGDEGELKLLRQEVMEQLLEEEYEESRPEFEKFAESFAPGRTDGRLEEVIGEFFDFSMGYPWPEEWRQRCLKEYQAETWEEAEEAEWLQALLEKLELTVKDLVKQMEQALNTAKEQDGPRTYLPMLESDLAMLEKLQDCKSYRAYADFFQKELSWEPLSRKKDPEASEAKKTLVKRIRDQVKDEVYRIQEEYFFESPEQILEDIRGAAPLVEELVRLAGRFQQMYQARKEEKNLVDFADLEHYALEILVRKEGEETVPTVTAWEYALEFEEVMIDEYQDSNLVQEILLSSVSSPERHNRFMVGDVKQSIYRFRLARPELFMEKYHGYARDGGENRRIDLHKNFRSRSQVLEGVNLVFRQIMTEKLGDVEYDDDAALYPGAQFPPADREEFYEPELWLVNADEPEDESEEKLERDLRRREAVMAAQCIREMAGREKIWDKEEGGYRPVRYGDVVVLLRTMAGWSETFMEVFREYQIPADTGSTTGYFSALEIKTVLSYLRVLDNPRQDIPLASALRSPFGGLTDEELALLRIGSPDTDFYTCCIKWMGQWKEMQPEAGSREAGLLDKMSRFWKQMEQLREELPYTPMHQLLWKILDVTGYRDYAAAMPGGEQRTANLDMLVEKAAAYEATSYRGLFHFVRYIENLQKYEVDYGEASAAGEAADTVRVMSIHKSKGLEFPVVLVCGLGKTFNQQDARGGLVFHASLGVGCDRIDPVYRIRRPLLPRKMIARAIREENLGEELRILYVAMTRAKEKLILTGGVRNLARSEEKWSFGQGRKEEKLSGFMLAGASSYLDWVMPALLRHPCSEEFRKEEEVLAPAASSVQNYPGSFSIHIQTRQREQQHRREQFFAQKTEEELAGLDLDRIYDQDTCRYLEKVMSGSYPYPESEKIPGKVSVSELKHLWYQEELPAQSLYREPVPEPLIPGFMEKEKRESGAARGTIYHRFLENMDFTGEFHGKFMDSQLETMVKCGKIHRDESGWISRDRINRFLETDLARRMQKAAREGNLFREQPFTLGLSASDIHSGWDPGETVLIQGIIDAYFYEEDGIVLVDYKTDYVPDGRPESLVSRYRIQLDYYRKALERLTGKPVRERLLYSFSLDRAIPV